jgi:hypothetical protein
MPSGLADAMHVWYLGGAWIDCPVKFLRRALPVSHDSRRCRNRNRGRQTIAAKLHLASDYDNDKDNDMKQVMLPVLSVKRRMWSDLY